MRPTRFLYQHLQCPTCWTGNPHVSPHICPDYVKEQRKVEVTLSDADVDRIAKRVVDMLAGRRSAEI